MLGKQRHGGNMALTCTYRETSLCFGVRPGRPAAVHVHEVCALERFIVAVRSVPRTGMLLFRRLACVKNRSEGLSEASVLQIMLYQEGFLWCVVRWAAMLAVVESGASESELVVIGDGLE